MEEGTEASKQSSDGLQVLQKQLSYLISSNLHFAGRSYHTAGAQNLINIWVAGEHLHGSGSKVTLEISQASRLRESFQIRSGFRT